MCDAEAESVARGLTILRTLSNSLLSFANGEKDTAFGGIDLDALFAGKEERDE